MTKKLKIAAALRQLPEKTIMAPYQAWHVFHKGKKKEIGMVSFAELVAVVEKKKKE